MKDVDVGRSLTADECFQIGKIAYEKKDYYHAGPWLEQAVQRAEDEWEYRMDLQHALDLASYSLYIEGHLEKAVKLVEQLLRLNPEHENGKSKACNGLRHLCREPTILPRPAEVVQAE